MKRVIKLAISFLVRTFDACHLAITRRVGGKPQPRCVVLYYHGVGRGQRDGFARQMDDLLRFARPVSVTSIDTLDGHDHYCAVTFDDGFVSVIDNALPELQERGIPAALFVPTGSLGSRPKWIKNPAAAAYNERVLSADQLMALETRDLVTIGAHSVSHPNFLTLNTEQAERELTQSKADLEAVLDKRITEFSFPHGACNEQLIELAKAAGYARVFTIKPQCKQNAGRKFVYGRVAVAPTDWPIEFRLKVLGAYRWLAVI